MLTSLPAAPQSVVVAGDNFVRPAALGEFDPRIPLWFVTNSLERDPFVAPYPRALSSTDGWAALLNDAQAGESRDAEAAVAAAGAAGGAAVVDAARATRMAAREDLLMCSCMKLRKDRGRARTEQQAALRANGVDCMPAVSKVAFGACGRGATRPSGGAAIRVVFRSRGRSDSERSVQCPKRLRCSRCCGTRA